MNIDKQSRHKYIDRYEGYLREFGYSPKALGWGKSGRQSVRFSILCADAICTPTSSVLDVGCGFADLYDYLIQQGWHGKYVGIDIVPGLIETARSRHPDLELHLEDMFNFNYKTSFDYVIASGIFNIEWEVKDSREYIQHALRKMFNMTKVMVCVDFLSTYVDYQQPIAWHTDPAWAFAVGKALSKRVALRHDYMPYEFALFIYKDDKITTSSVFEAFEWKFKAGMTLDGQK